MCMDIYIFIYIYIYIYTHTHTHRERGEVPRSRLAPPGRTVIMCLSETYILIYIQFQLYNGAAPAILPLLEGVRARRPSTHYDDLTIGVQGDESMAGPSEYDSMASTSDSNLPGMHAYVCACV